MPTDEQVVSCPFDRSDALEFDPALVALAARGPDSRIRLPCGEAGAWLMTSHVRVRRVTRDPRLSRAAIVGRDHPRMAPEPIVVDLTTRPYEREEFSVVKVCAPHLRYSSRHTIPRPPLEASA